MQRYFSALHFKAESPQRHDSGVLAAAEQARSALSHQPFPFSVALFF